MKGGGGNQGPPVTERRSRFHAYWAEDRKFPGLEKGQEREDKGADNTTNTGQLREGVRETDSAEFQRRKKRPISDFGRLEGTLQLSKRRRRDVGPERTY